MTGKITDPLLKKQNKARTLSNRAIRIGGIKRLDHCESCLKKCKTYAHHPDYNKPLYLIFLCPKCHAQEHKKMKLKNISNLDYRETT